MELTLDSLKAITIIIDYEDEDGPQEERHTGYLTGYGYAFYIIQEYATLCFASVVATDEVGIYRAVKFKYMIEKLTEPGNDKEVILKLAQQLHRMSGYEFLARVILNVQSSIEFEGWLLPGLLNETN